MGCPSPSRWYRLSAGRLFPGSRAGRALNRELGYVNISALSFHPYSKKNLKFQH